MKKLLCILLISTVSFSQTQIGNEMLGETLGDGFGFGISLSSDGTVVAISAPYNDGNGESSGHIRVFKNNNGVWEQIGNDIEGENSGDASGTSISLNSDGSILAIGATSNDSNGGGSGHVRVYRNNEGVWEQIGNDIDGNHDFSFLGSGVSLSSDGSIVAIGAPGHHENVYRSGHVRVYRNNEGIWEQIGNDIDGFEEEDSFGTSVSLSSDGTVVACGAPSLDSSNPGFVGIYSNNNGVWEQIGSNIYGESPDDSSGRSVSLSSDGTIVAIGAPHNDGNGSFSGHVRVYRNNNGVWEQIGSDIDGENSGNLSGGSVSLSSDGTVVAINEQRFWSSGGTPNVRVFRNNNEVWQQMGNTIVGTYDWEDSYLAVSLNSDGDILAVGEAHIDTNGRNSGRARVFQLSTILSTNSFVEINTSMYPNPANKEFTVELKENLVLEKISIYNPLGQLVKISRTKITDVLDLSSGLYFVEIRTDQGKSTQKLIIE